MNRCLVLFAMFLLRCTQASLFNHLFHHFLTGLFPLGTVLFRMLQVLVRAFAKHATILEFLGQGNLWNFAIQLSQWTGESARIPTRETLWHQDQIAGNAQWKSQKIPLHPGASCWPGCWEIVPKRRIRNSPRRSAHSAFGEHCGAMRET